jgi:hypothetical protein
VNEPSNQKATQPPLQRVHTYLTHRAARKAAVMPAHAIPASAASPSVFGMSDKKPIAQDTRAA